MGSRYCIICVQFCQLQIFWPEMLGNFFSQNHENHALYRFHPGLGTREIVPNGLSPSSIVSPNGDHVWVIAEADRSSTTILLPSEY